MNKFLRHTGRMLAVICISACSDSAVQIEARTANAIALEANNTLPAVVRIYTDEGLAVIRAAASADAANLGLAQVRSRWRRVWGTEADGSPCVGVGTSNGTPCRNGAWQGLSASENTWALALERQIAGQPIDLATATRMGSDLHASYCALRGAMPDGVHLPDPPSFLTCGPSGSPIQLSSPSPSPALSASSSASP